MDARIQDKLYKLYQLFQKGSTPGEKAAAKEAIDRLMLKHDLDNMNFDQISRREYRFKYSTELEMWLFSRILTILLGLKDINACRTNYKIQGERYITVREIKIDLDELDFITLEAAYEYFRGHMKSEWKRVAAPAIKRCRTAKTRAKRREELKPEFFSRYIIASKLYEEDEVTQVDLKTKRDYEKAMMFSDVQGGEYNKQVNNGLFLDK